MLATVSGFNFKKKKDSSQEFNTENTYCTKRQCETPAAFALLLNHIQENVNKQNKECTNYSHIGHFPLT